VAEIVLRRGEILSSDVTAVLTADLEECLGDLRQLHIRAASIRTANTLPPERAASFSLARPRELGRGTCGVTRGACERYWGGMPSASGWARR
jgi:hypothetical protein